MCAVRKNMSFTRDMNPEVDVGVDVQIENPILDRGANVGQHETESALRTMFDNFMG